MKNKQKNKHNSKITKTINIIHLGFGNEACGGTVVELDPSPTSFMEYFCESCGFTVPEYEVTRSMARLSNSKNKNNPYFVKAAC